MRNGYTSEPQWQVFDNLKNRLKSIAAKKDGLIYIDEPDEFEIEFVRYRYHGVTEVKLGKRHLDLLLTITDNRTGKETLIDIEYDGITYHDPEKDAKKDEFLKSHNISVIHIQTVNKQPKIDDILQIIKMILNEGIWCTRYLRCSDYNDTIYTTPAALLIYNRKKKGGAI